MQAWPPLRLDSEPRKGTLVKVPSQREIPQSEEVLARPLLMSMITLCQEQREDFLSLPKQLEETMDFPASPCQVAEVPGQIA